MNAECGMKDNCFSAHHCAFIIHRFFSVSLFLCDEIKGRDRLKIGA
jgi:hypothetical protein